MVSSALLVLPEGRHRRGRAPLDTGPVVSLNTTRSLGLTVPASILVRASEVIQ